MMSESVEQIKNRFLDDVKNHQMTVEVDSGVNRSILFQKVGYSLML